MKYAFVTTLLFAVFAVNSFADFAPLENEVLLLRSELSTSERFDKKKLESSLNRIMEKATEIENKIAKNDITGDLNILLKKYVEKNKSNEVDSKEVDFWLKHIVDDLAMFRKMGIEK